MLNGRVCGSHRKLKELPDDWKGATEDWKTHPLGFFTSVVDRLKTVDRLVAEASDPWFPLAKSGLALFILCTCVESLGRTREFLTYHDWLKSARTRTEVEEAIDRFKNEGSLSFLNSVLEQYQSIFGFRRSFTNFFNNCLTKEWQDRLAKTIDVTINRPPNFIIERVEDPLKNLVEYLEDFRNRFAHGMELIYQVPLEGEIPNEWKESWNEKFEHIRFFTYQKVYSDGSFKTVTTKNLLGTLNQAIRIALWEWIKNHTREET